MGLNETYIPFLHEGRMTPRADDLQSYLKGDDLDFPWLLRAAVRSELLTDALANLAELWLAGDEQPSVETAFRMVEALELRRLRGAMLSCLERFDGSAEQMLCTGQLDVTTRAVTRFGPGQFERTAGQMKGYPIGWVGVDILLRLCIPGDPILGRVKAYASARPSLYPLAWRALEADEVATSLDWVGGLLMRAPQFAVEVATRFALLAPDACEALAARCVKLPSETREAIAGTLQKNLLRTGRVRVWVACREALKAISHSDGPAEVGSESS